MSKRVEWLSRTLVTSPIYIGICFDEKQFESALRKAHVPRGEWPQMAPAGVYASTTTLQHPDGKKSCIVGIRRGTKGTKAEIHALLAHEATHVWQKIREELGEDRPSPEFEAYSIQAITQNLCEAWDARNKKR